MNEQEKDSTGIRLLKKGKKGLVHVIFSRMGLILVLMVLQVFLMVGIFQWFEQYLPHIFSGSLLFTIIMVLYLLNSRLDPSAKLTWMVLIMVAPVVGAVLLLYTQTDIGHRTVAKRLQQLTKETMGCIPQSEETLTELSHVSPESAMLTHYVGRTGCYPVFRHTDVTYFPSGEDKFEEMLKQLEQAEHFIFMEYFIVDEGVMWGKILEILAKKAAEGVEIRFLYDGTCEFSLLPHDYPKRLRKLGIQCKVFLPATPFVSTHYNFRDHRKILVIDGHTAFTGGINLADEYINHIERFGYWKDTAIMLKGDAVKSFTLMFLQMWSIDEKRPDFETYLHFPAKSQRNAAGYVLPYGDSPLDSDKVGERIYMDILNHAKRYVHIMSPYLILDGEMETALKFAAERGVDVTLILPGIPDKKIPYALAKTHYPSLLQSGVKIYEYTPGFVHAKVFTSDDCKGVVGTINLDYRSLYHHFECAAYLYGVSCISDMEQDFQNTLKKCREITKESVLKMKWNQKLLGILMKWIAPLM
jgi:cardiolipin synthase